ncbi:mirror-image polydactyly 1 [Cricetulus griseus]
MRCGRSPARRFGHRLTARSPEGIRTCRCCLRLPFRGRWRGTLETGVGTGGLGAPFLASRKPHPTEGNRSFCPVKIARAPHVSPPLAAQEFVWTVVLYSHGTTWGHTIPQLPSALPAAPARRKPRPKIASGLAHARPEKLRERSGRRGVPRLLSANTAICLVQGASVGSESAAVDEQLTMNSEENMHLLDKEVTSEDLKLPGNNSSNLQAIGPYPDEGASTKCSIMECEKNDMNYESGTPHQVSPDLNKEITVDCLQKELEILRTSNKKLQEKLTKEDKEKRKLKLKLELHEKAAEAEIAERTAALVEEVYFAQRERDEAIMCRLQLALEERDEAVARVKHMEMSLKMLENINPEENDMTLQELLSRINNADTGLAIQKNGAIIVDRIYKTKECKKRITAEEMNAVIEERDAALSQCKRLHQELHRLKEQKQTSANNMRHPTAENNQERALKVNGRSFLQAN